MFSSNISEGTDKSAPINYLGQTLSAPPEYAISLADGVHLTIEGNQQTLGSANGYRDLFIYAGQVTINNLTIENPTAAGGRRCWRLGGGWWRRSVGEAYSSPAGTVTPGHGGHDGDNAKPMATAFYSG